jgi:mono/diheme cytochrome c family protein
MLPAHSNDRSIPALSDAAVISAGRQIFAEKHCSHCHGANGDGGVNLTKRDLSDPKYIFLLLPTDESVAGCGWPHAGAF